MSEFEWEGRFWSKVERGSGCWGWLASTVYYGYGQFCLNGRMQRAHRVSYRIAKGPIPEGMCVLHTCDNPPCVNPSHLYLGTQADNARDRVARGRHVSSPGERNGFSKLTETDVLAIRKSGAPQRELGSIYGVTKSAISLIRRGRNWPHVGGPRTYGPRNRKLDAPAARDIFVSSDDHTTLAVRHGVHKSLVSQIKRRKAWAHATRELHD